MVCVCVWGVCVCLCVCHTYMISMYPLSHRLPKLWRCRVNLRWISTSISKSGRHSIREVQTWFYNQIRFSDRSRSCYFCSSLMIKEETKQNTWSPKLYHSRKPFVFLKTCVVRTSHFFKIAQKNKPLLSFAGVPPCFGLNWLLPEGGTSLNSQAT